MRITISDVMRQLRAEGLVANVDDTAIAGALHAAEADDVPWYVRLAAGAGAWTATALLIGFMGAMGIVDDETSALAIGVVFVVAAVALRRQTTVEFLKHFCVAVSFTGQALLLFGIYRLDNSELLTALAALALSIGLIILVPDSLHRFLSVLVGSTAAVVVAGDLEVQHGFEGVVLVIVLLTAYVWRIALPRAGKEREEMLVPVSHGLVITLFGMLLVGSAFAVVPSPATAEHVNVWRLGAVATIGTTIALVALLLAILEEQGTSPTSPRALVYVVAVLLLGAVTLSTPGIVAGAAVLTLGFDRRHNILMGIAVLFLLVFGSVYYYSLSITLLQKSGVLMASGLLLLVVRQLIAYGRPAEGST